uniref:Uncharacterized protein n=1 Tax=Mycobacterium leprae TaxID=1769 RepID=O32972_MYCLR|nr:hypothetical protein MLCB22.39 [Mycobacterium leprae]
MPSTQAKVLAIIEAHGDAHIGDLAAVDHCSPTNDDHAGATTPGCQPSYPNHRPSKMAVLSESATTPQRINTLNAVRADRIYFVFPTGPAIRVCGTDTHCSPASPTWTGQTRTALTRMRPSRS